ncbi:MAG: type II toxin-antitoxin system HipA family toxin [Candidatus Limnocylindria bacterium]
MMAAQGDRLIVVLDSPELRPPTQVGTLIRWPGRGEHRPISFAYDESWLADRDAFPLDPRTLLFSGDQQLGTDTLPPALGDTTPDTWGQMLLAREQHRLLSSWELLVGVADETRMGALRLAAGADGPFLRSSLPHVPALASLRELQELAHKVEEDPDAEIDDQRLRDLVLPGSSLGGARPKANVRDTDGTLWIAKFPSRDDRRLDIGAWEFIYANLAEHAGISVAAHRLIAVGPGRGRTYLVRRFDRADDDARRLFVSAMTLTDRRDGEAASYPDIAQAISRFGARGSVRTDLAQLFRRLLFNVVTGNRDDHLRNHGFLRARDGWRLAPAFDMNPARATHPHSLSLDGVSGDQSVHTALSTHRLYALSEDDALGILREVVAAASGWERQAGAVGVPEPERRIVESALTALPEARDLVRA